MTAAVALLDMATERRNVSTTLRHPGLEFKLYLVALVQAVVGIGSLEPLVQTRSFEVLPVAVLGFRIA
jgi:hypothetical protein